MIDQDALLARQAREGDAVAFGRLIERHQTAALRTATVVLGTSTGADDAVQDAAIRTWNAIGTFRTDGTFRSWYLRIVANTARNSVRSRGRRATLALRATNQRPIDDADPGDQAITADERERVLGALNRLAEPDRLVLALRYFEHLSEAETATVLDCAVGTVKSRSSRALDRLRAAINEADSHA